MSELAFLFVRTESILDKLFTQLAFLFVLLLALIFLMEQWFGQRVRIVSGRLGGIGRGGRKTLFVETFGMELESLVFFDELPASRCH